MCACAQAIEPAGFSGMSTGGGRGFVTVGVRGALGRRTVGTFPIQGVEVIRELDVVTARFPMDAIVLFKGRPIGNVIGYRRANGTDSIEVLFKHFPEFAHGGEGQFTPRSPSYKAKF